MVEMERKMNEDEEIRGVRVGWSAPARRTAALDYTSLQLSQEKFRESLRFWKLVVMNRSGS